MRKITILFLLIAASAHAQQYQVIYGGWKKPYSDFFPTHYRSTFDEYTNFSVKTDVGIGWDARFLVSKSGSLYNSYGVFESRIIDGGGGNTWRSWDARIGDDANKLISDPSIVAYYAMDNDGWVNAATGLSGTPVGGLEFTTDSIIGSHAGRFIYPRYLVTHNPTLLNGATECTIALWVKLNSFVLDHAYIMSRGSKTMGIVFRALALQAFSCFLNGDLVPAPNNSISLDEWMFISFTWKASNNTLIVYKNGVEVARGPVSGASVSQTTEFRIGSDSAIGTRITDGVIDEVVIWNRAISSNEVAELYNLRYAQFSPVRVQVRSGSSPANVLTKDFVGRDGTTNSFLIGKGLPTSQDFNPTERYAQYRAHITVAQNRLKSPYVDMVGLIGDNGMRFDDLYGDFLQGNTNDHIALEPKESPNGYLGLRRLDNGGFSTNGTYTSEAIDAGVPMAWSKIAWISNGTGAVNAQVRYGNDLPITSPFVGVGNNPFAYYDNGDELAGYARYAQYRLYLASEEGTPKVYSVAISNANGWVPEQLCNGMCSSNDMENAECYGEEITKHRLVNLVAVNQSYVYDYSCLGNWHLDDLNYSDGLLDSAYKSGMASNFNAQPFVKGHVGERCTYFSGQTNYLMTPPLYMPDDFTFSLWFKTSSSNRSVIASNDDGAGYFTMAISNGAVSLTIVNGDTNTATSRRTDLNDDEWHSLVAVREKTQIHLFVDGDRDASANLGGAGLAWFKPIYIGREGGVKTAFFKGYVDDIAVWSRAFKDHEVGSRVFAGYETLKTGEVVSDIIDGGQPVIWQTMKWLSEGSYGSRLTKSDPTLKGLWSMEALESASISNTIDGTLSSVSGTPSLNTNGRIGSCMSFKGGDHVSLSDDLNLTEFSVEGWLNTTSIFERAIFYSASEDDILLRITENGIPSFAIGSHEALNDIPVRLGKWTHLCGTFDGTDARLYVDGKMVSITNASGADVSNGSAQIGGSSDLENYYLIDEVAVHNRALKAEEVLDHYKAGVLSMKFQCRTSDSRGGLDSAIFYGVGKDTNTFFTVPATSNLTGSLNVQQYLQFRTIFKTEDHRYAPSLKGVFLECEKP